MNSLNLLKSLDFTYFSAQNFLCFGPEGVEIDLKKLGNIVLIRGENLDIIDDNEEEKIASNGIGKALRRKITHTSLPES